jgi:thiamine-phosphate pyrophosphorylase
MVDIAVVSEADGVHLGQNEIPVSAARKLADRPLIVGVSTHNLKELNAAIESGCDYVGIGPAYSSPTKPHLEVAGLDYVHEALEVLSKTNIFHVAIGGICEENLSELLDTGVSAIAVSKAIEHTTSPENSFKTLKSMLLNHSQ